MVGFRHLAHQFRGVRQCCETEGKPTHVSGSTPGNVFLLRYKNQWDVKVGVVWGTKSSKGVNQEHWGLGCEWV